MRRGLHLPQAHADVERQPGRACEPALRHAEHLLVPSPQVENLAEPQQRARLDLPVPRGARRLEQLGVTGLRLVPARERGQRVHPRQAQRQVLERLGQVGKKIEQRRGAALAQEPRRQRSQQLGREVVEPGIERMAERPLALAALAQRERGARLEGPPSDRSVAALDLGAHERPHELRPLEGRRGPVAEAAQQPAVHQLVELGAHVRALRQDRGQRCVETGHRGGALEQLAGARREPAVDLGREVVLQLEPRGAHLRAEIGG